MATSYDPLINALWDSWQTAYGWAASLGGNYDEAAAHWIAGDDHAALEDVIQGMWDTNQALINILKKGYYGWDGATFALLTALDRNKACPFITEADIPAIDMTAILVAMKNAKPHQPLLFVGYLEAYKASVWNATFDETFFADLVRKWMIWG